MPTDTPAAMDGRFVIPFALNGDEPPVDLLLFRAGPNETTKGTFLFDDESAEMVMAEYVDRGIKRTGDYEHASILPAAEMLNPVEQGRACCRYDLELRPAAEPKPGATQDLWAVRIEWTPEADRQLRAKERLYYSQAFETDKGGHVVRYKNFAITNDPATKRMMPLVAATDSAPAPTERKMSMLGNYLTQRMTAANLTAAQLAANAGMNEEEMKSLMACGDGEMPKAMRGKLRGLSAALKCKASYLRALADGDEEECKTLTAEEEELASLKKRLTDAPPPPKEKEDEAAKNLTALSVKLTGKADRKDALAAVAPLAEIGAELVKLTGKNDPAEVVGLVRGKFTAADQGSALAAEVQALKADAAARGKREREADFDRVVREAKEAGKLSPAEIADTAEGTPGAYLAACRADEKGGLVALRAFVSALPAKVPVEARREPKSAGTVTLTDDDRKIAASLGIDPKDVEKTKAEARARTAAQS